MFTLPAGCINNHTTYTARICTPPEIKPWAKPALQTPQYLLQCIQDVPVLQNGRPIIVVYDQSIKPTTW